MNYHEEIKRLTRIKATSEAKAQSLKLTNPFLSVTYADHVTAINNTINRLHSLIAKQELEKIKFKLN